MKTEAIDPTPTPSCVQQGTLTPCLSSFLSVSPIDVLLDPVGKFVVCLLQLTDPRSEVLDLVGSDRREPILLSNVSPFVGGPVDL